MGTRTCRCCGYITLGNDEHGSYQICPICYWEEDPVQAADPDYSGGANKVSLRQAQKNFIQFGACEKKMVKYVRRPDASEMKDLEWKLVD